MEKILIGKVLKAQGIKGEMKISLYSNDVEHFKNIKNIFIKNKEYVISKVRIALDNIFITLKDFDDRTKIEEEGIISKDIYINKNQRKKLEKGRFYISDIIGIDVIVGDKLLGQVLNIDQFGSADIYTIKTDKKNILFPLIKKVIINFDIENKKLILDENIFKEISIYED